MCVCGDCKVGVCWWRCVCRGGSEVKEGLSEVCISYKAICQEACVACLLAYLGWFVVFSFTSRLHLWSYQDGY